MIVMTLNGERIPLQMEEGEDFDAFAKRATDEEIISILARVIQLVYRAGGTDADAQRAVSDVSEQIGVRRGTITTH